MCSSNVKLLSIVIPKSFCELILLMTESKKKWHETIKYFLSCQFLLIYRSMGNIRKEWYHPHGLQYQNSSRLKNKSQISILDSSGPSIDPWGTWHKISNSLLNEEPTFCDLSSPLSQLEFTSYIKLRLRWYLCLTYILVCQFPRRNCKPQASRNVQSGSTAWKRVGS